MIGRLRFRPYRLLTLATLLALALLAQLGEWQWRRYQEKRAHAGEIETMTLVRFAPVLGKLQLVYGVRDGQAVWRLFAPVTQDGEIVFLDMAEYPGLAPPDWRTIKEPFTGDAAIRGAPIRPHAPSLFAAKPDLGRHLWYAVDLPAMAKAAGGEPASYYLAVDYLGPDGARTPNPWAQPALRDPLPPERHFGYAITWWGLAAALLGVYAAYHVKAGRLSFGRRKS